MNQAKNQIPSRLKHSNMLLLTRVHTHSVFQVSPLRTYYNHSLKSAQALCSHIHTCVHTHCTPSCNAKIAPHPHSTHQVCPHIHACSWAPPDVPWPWEEDGERSPERIESATYWPPSDPFHSVGEGPARSKRMGWGWGGTALPAAGILHACAHTFAGGGGTSPVSTPGPSRVPR